MRVSRACVCGSDLHPYHSMPADPAGSPMGHEFIGVVEAAGTDVTTLRAGDYVIAPFAVSCGVCEFCRAGLQTSCVNGGFWNDPALGTGGGEAEAVRVPLADGTLVRVPGVNAATDEALLASLLTLSDVYGTGWHAAARGGVTEGSTVTVIGDGAVGLLAVLSAKQLGAERIVLLGRHQHASLATLRLWVAGEATVPTCTATRRLATCHDLGVGSVSIADSSVGALDGSWERA